MPLRFFKRKMENLCARNLRAQRFFRSETSNPYGPGWHALHISSVRPA